MKLIIESGSTKADWVLTKRNQVVTRFKSLGLNPLHLKKEDLALQVEQAVASNQYLKGVDSVMFYGAGIIGIREKQLLANVLGKYLKTKKVQVFSDIDVLVESKKDMDECFLVVLGTGTKTALVERGKIKKSLLGLGYLLGDYGSGTHIGKYVLEYYVRGFFSSEVDKFLYNYLKKDKEEVIREMFLRNGHASTSRFLSSLAKLIYPMREDETIKKLIYSSFQIFVDKELSKYTFSEDTPIYVYGSVGYYFQDILKDCLNTNNYHNIKFRKSPIEDLLHLGDTEE